MRDERRTTLCADLFRKNTMDFDATYIQQCAAPGIEPAAIEDVINETSGYNELAVKVQTKDGRKAIGIRQPTTAAGMVETVTSYSRTGAEVRFGIMLVPARLLPELKVSVGQAAEPCTNIRIGSLVYQRARAMASATGSNARDLRRETLRAYVTGSYDGTPIESLTPSGPVVVSKPPLRDFEKEARGAGERDPRRVAEVYASTSRDGGPDDATKPSLRPTSGPPAQPTIIEVMAAPMTIDLSRFREAR